ILLAMKCFPNGVQPLPSWLPMPFCAVEMINSCVSQSPCALGRLKVTVCLAILTIIFGVIFSNIFKFGMFLTLIIRLLKFTFRSIWATYVQRKVVTEVNRPYDNYK